MAAIWLSQDTLRMDGHLPVSYYPIWTVPQAPSGRARSGRRRDRPLPNAEPFRPADAIEFDCAPHKILSRLLTDGVAAPSGRQRLRVEHEVHAGTLAAGDRQDGIDAAVAHRRFRGLIHAGVMGRHQDVVELQQRRARRWLAAECVAGGAVDVARAPGG